MIHEIIMTCRRASINSAIDEIGALHLLTCTDCATNAKDALLMGQDVLLSSKAETISGRVDNTQHIIGVCKDK